ncbi:MAG TPA: carbohydrate ABC transporter permease, partial [Bacilli bacterium]
TAKAAQIFLAALPILVVYIFLQKYFVKGMVMGSVKE